MRGRRTLGLSLLALLIVAASIEGLSFLLLRLTQGEWMGWQKIRQRQLEVRQLDAAGPDPVVRQEQVPEHLSQYVVHPYLGFVLDRSFKTAHRISLGGDEAVEYGFTLPAPGLFEEPSPETLVVGVTGGSLAQSWAKRASGYLEQLLVADLPGVERVRVVDLALPGYKQPQQLMTLAYFLSLGVHFDVFLNLDGFNDVALPVTDNLNKGVFPFFPRGWHVWMSDFDPDLLPRMGEVMLLRQRRANLAAAFGRRPLAYSVTAGLVWTRLDQWAAAGAARAAVGLLEAPGSGDKDYRVTGPQRRYQDEAEMYRDLAGFWMRCSQLMNSLAENEGIVYLHFLQPNQYLRGSKPMGREERQVALAARHPYRRPVSMGYPELLRRGEELRAMGVRFHDLTPLFSEVREPLYVDTCCHVNEKGNRLIAEAIARAVIAALR